MRRWQLRDVWYAAGMTRTLEEHIDYLSLPNRSDAFRSAIKQSLPKNALVADLGCGVGVLGLFCLEAGARKVWGIDHSDAIDLARETVSRAGLSDKFECIRSSTFETSLPEKVDVLICDHVGYFGFDYGIVDMLRDAAKRMLKTDGQIIPDRLALHVCAASSDACAHKANAWSSDIVPQPLHWIEEQAKNASYSHQFSREELIAQPCQLGTIALGQEAKEYFVFETEITIGDGARFDGLAGWFEAHLGGDIWMTNSPLDNRSIRRPQLFLPINEPFDVKAGDVVGIKIRARSDGQFMAWEVQPPGDAPLQKQSTWAITALGAGGLTEMGAASVHLSDYAQDTLVVLSFVDGKRTADEIEKCVIQQAPTLRRTTDDIRTFVQSVIKRHAKT